MVSTIINEFDALATMSIAAPASLEAKMAMAMMQEMTAPVSTLVPKSTFSASPQPATLPMLKTSHFSDDQQGNEMTEARQDSVGHVLTAHAAHGDDAPDVHLCADVDDDRSEDCECGSGGELLVATAVCVRNPGPMADVAMMNAAPSSTDRALRCACPIAASAMMPPCRCVMPEEGSPELRRVLRVWSDFAPVQPMRSGGYRRTKWCTVRMK